MISDTHGDLKLSAGSGGISSIASEKKKDPSTMAFNSPGENPPSDSPARPPFISHQSNSLPSTPYQRARDLSFRSSSPSPPRGSVSPRSTHSESTHIPQSLRKPLVGCKYETAMAYFRRRMPYTLGADLLPPQREGLKAQLNPEEDERLTADILEVYDRLLPSAESDDRRRQLVRKLEKLFNNQWPGQSIKAHVFGSSGNKLCSSDSDVDICITTTYKELEHVCLLAEVLAKHGMERVVCVSHAKVPIVKIWDPELRLACDMNVNNTMALENTRMVRTYVDVDERVRPLAMIVKYWTKRRVLNDAALGGTLSSYSWICLIINFLQTRNPPILPSLQARPHQKRVTAEGIVCSFDDNMEALAGFGRKNKQTLGDLLFQFFRYYGHELDYEKSVISVREGRLVSKEAKGWHLLQNNRLCVEEPFNTSRNLGNTADDTSVRGLHMELRRAFKVLSDGSLDECCAQYEFPPEEERSWERPPQQPRPIIPAVPSYASRGGRGGGRGGAVGGRHPNQFSRAGYPGRRTSNPAGKPNNHNNFRHPNVTMNPSDMSGMLAQHAQCYLNDQLYQQMQMQILQAPKQMQLQNQALVTGRPSVLVRQPYIQFPVTQQEAPGDENSRSRSGTVNHPPVNASRQPVYYSPAYFPVTIPGVQGSGANPPSPSPTTAAPPDSRRDPRRSSVANGSPGGSLRAHSQPARPLHPQPFQGSVPFYAVPQPVENSQNSKQQQQHLASGSPPEGSQGDDENLYMSSIFPNGSRSVYLDESRPSEYIGYYLGSSPQLQACHSNSILTPMSTSVGLALQNGYYPVVQDYRQVMPSSSNEAFVSPFDPKAAPNAKSVSSQRRQSSRPVQPGGRGPLIVDGSVPLSDHRSSPHVEALDQYASNCASSSDDHIFDTSASGSDSFSQDLHDNSSMETDGPVFARQPMEIYKLNNYGEARINGQSGRAGLLSNRLQNFHLSNSERLAEHSLKTGTDKQKAAQSNHELVDKDAHRPRQATTAATSAASGLHPRTAESHVQPPPNGKRRANGVDSEKVNGFSHHKTARPRGRHEPSNMSTEPVDGRERRVDNSRRKQNGVVHSTHGANGAYGTGTHSTGGWQTTKRKHKRNAKSSVEPRHIHAGTEPLPADESLRKGG